MSEHTSPKVSMCPAADPHGERNCAAHGPTWVSVGHASDYFGIHRDTIRAAMKRMVAGGYTGVRKTGSRWQIDLNAMDDFFGDEARRALVGYSVESSPESAGDGRSTSAFDIPRTWR